MEEFGLDLRKKVLIGDDSADFGAICQNALREKGYEVLLRKKDGFEILSAISSEKPDLVVMSARMIHVDALGSFGASKAGQTRHGSSSRPLLIIR